MRPESDASALRSQSGRSQTGRSQTGRSRTGRSQPSPSQPTNEEILHSWPGVVGPRPTILSLLSLALIAAIFAHLVFDLPSWWPFAAGAVALAVNLALAFWQAGSVRVVAVTESGIRVMRKARWRSRCTHLVGTMPRMPLGPVGGRWSRSSVANTVMWVHRRHHPIIADFDSRYLSTFNDWNSGHTSRAVDRGSVLEGLDHRSRSGGRGRPGADGEESLTIDIDKLEAEGSGADRMAAADTAGVDQPDGNEVGVD